MGLAPGEGVGWMVLWALCGLLACGMLRHDGLPSGDLSWDGASWTFTPCEGMPLAVSVQVLWDAGAGMLLGVRSRNGDWRGNRCCWVSESLLPLHSHACRCAVHTRKLL